MLALTFSVLVPLNICNQCDSIRVLLRPMARSLSEIAIITTPFDPLCENIVKVMDALRLAWAL